MEDNNKNGKVENIAKTPVAVGAVKDFRAKRGFGAPGQRGGGRPGQRRDGRPGLARDEFENKILTIRRVTRVVSGGKRFNFSVYIVVGDKKGSVGVGTGKAGDTSQAIEKAMKNAKKNMIKVKLTKEMSIPCETSVKYSSAVVTLKPASGKGMIAGSSVRDVLVLAGVKDVNAKVLSRTKNKINNARATVEALKKLNYLCNFTK